VNGLGNDNESSENNIQNIILGTLQIHLLKDLQIIRNGVFDSIAHWFSTNTFGRFMCAFQIGSLLQILRKKFLSDGY
jgi:hypothetical protein